MHVLIYNVYMMYRLIAQNTPAATLEPTSATTAMSTTAVTVPVTVAPTDVVKPIDNSDTVLYSVKLMTSINSHAVSQFNQTAFTLAVIAVIGDVYTDRMTVVIDAVTPVQQSALVQTSNNNDNGSKQHYHMRQRRRIQHSASSVNVLYTVQHIQGLQRADTVSTLLQAGDVLLGSKYATAAALTGTVPITVTTTTADTSTNGLTIETGIKGHKLPIATIIGGCAAGAILLVLVGALLWLVNRRRKARAAMLAKHSDSIHGIRSDKRLDGIYHDKSADAANSSTGIHHVSEGLAPISNNSNSNSMTSIASTALASVPQQLRQTLSTTTKPYSSSITDSYKGTASSADDSEYGYINVNGFTNTLANAASADSSGSSQKAQAAQQPTQQLQQLQRKYTSSRESTAQQSSQPVRHSTVRSTLLTQQSTVLSFTTDGTGLMSDRNVSNGMNSDTSEQQLPQQSQPSLSRKASSAVIKLSKQASSLVQQGVDKHGTLVMSGNTILKAIHILKCILWCYLLYEVYCILTMLPVLITHAVIR
jgi:hypothetical protein